MNLIDYGYTESRPSAYTTNWYKSIDTDIACQTNDKLSYWVTIYKWNDGFTYSIQIRAEALNKLWLDFQFYSIGGEDFIANIDDLESKL